MAMKLRHLKEIEFATPGEVVEGRLMMATPVKYRDGGTNVDYLVKTEGRGLLAFKGSAMLNKLLFPSDLGCLVSIKFVGLDAAPAKEGMSRKKIFEVKVDEDSKVASAPHAKSAGDSLTITDDDIPF
jgi:hypothetical protein